MILRPFLYEPTACASYLFGCTGKGRLAVVDPHVELVEAYLAEAERIGAPIVAVLETHVQADHVSGLPALVAATGARAHLPRGAEARFDHRPLADGERLDLGNTLVTTLMTPGHAPAHAAYLVADRRRGTEAPWMAFTGDSLLVGDVGRPDLHADGDPREMARLLHGSIGRLMALPDHVSVYPSHFGGSVCGRSLSGNPFSTIGFERRHNPALRHPDADAFAEALVADMPPRPEHQAAIVAANREGRAPAPA
jgi:glyoxylase-like metal-dependent hydrolase (beta-lactamase superfamily II)